MAIRPADHGVVSSSGAGAGFAYSTTGSPDVTTHGIYTSLNFTGTGTLVIASNPDNLTMDWFQVGGGANSLGGVSGQYCGGGGAGGTYTSTGQVMTVGTWNMTIGGSATNTTIIGPSSSPSLTANLGGNPGATSAGSAGGCGGGGGGPGNNAGGSGSQGSSGGAGNQLYAESAWHYAGGGGGGQSAAGGAGNPGSYSAGYGGAGINNDYKTGSTTSYAGGGGGSFQKESMVVGRAGSTGYGGGAANGGSGAANTGGGGSAGGTSGSGGSGGSGVVVVRWVTPT